MNKNLTEMVFILDRSGSMSGLENDTIGGYNSLLQKQKNEAGEALVTTVLFDDKYEMIHDCADIKTIKPMTNKEYYARGCTALLDAVGKTINTVSTRHKSLPENEIPSKTVVVIITDGYENASREFNQATIKAMIERQKEESNWEFLFLGANIDAEQVAGKYGISKDMSVNYEADSVGIKTNFSAVSNTLSHARMDYSLSINSDWKNEIEDYRRNKHK